MLIKKCIDIWKGKAEWLTVKTIDGTDYPMKKPDCDNVVKIVLDSLNKIAYDDDKQVVELTVLKRWTFDNERIEFEMEEIK